MSFTYDEGEGFNPSRFSSASSVSGSPRHWFVVVSSDNDFKAVYIRQNPSPECKFCQGGTPSTEAIALYSFCCSSAYVCIYSCFRSGYGKTKLIIILDLRQ